MSRDSKLTQKEIDALIKIEKRAAPRFSEDMSSAEIGRKRRQEIRAAGAELRGTYGNRKRGSN